MWGEIAGRSCVHVPDLMMMHFWKQYGVIVQAGVVRRCTRVEADPDIGTVLYAIVMA